MEGIVAAIEYAKRQKAAQLAAAGGARPAVRPSMPPPAPRPGPAAPPASAPAPAPPAAAPEHPSKPAQAGPLASMFEDGNSLLRAFVASEILGLPAALREQHHWNLLPNEP